MADKKGIRLYQCDLCEYESNLKSNLEKHRQYHLNKSTHQCNRCSYSVSTSYRLTLHRKNHHSEPDQVIGFIFLLKFVRNVYNFRVIIFFKAENDLLFQVLGNNSVPRHESKRVKRQHENDESSTDEVDNLIQNVCNHNKEIYLSLI